MRRSSLVAATVATLLLDVQLAHADGSRTEFNLPAQPLAASLRAIAGQTSSNILFDQSLVDGLSARPLKAQLTTEEALKALLRDTGLTYRTTDDKTVMILSEHPTARFPSTGDGTGAGDEGTQGVIRLAQNVQSTTDRDTGSASEDEENPASSRDSESQDPAKLEVVVTGSHIRGVQNDALPTISLSREDIRDTGLPTLPEVLQALPQNFRVPQNSFGVSLPDLRGLGSTYTLVLINGRRTAAAYEQLGVDLSTIPLNAIERIEVLTDGAAAVYGSDAIGGVINVILRKDFTGAETDVYYGHDTRSSAHQRWRATQSLGASWHSGHGLLNYSYENQNILAAADREATSNPGYSQVDPASPHTLHGLQGSIEQKVSDRWELYAEGRYTRRAQDMTTRSFVMTFDNEHTSYGGTAGARVSFGRNWQLDGSVTYNHSEIAQEAEFLSFPIPGFFQVTKGKTISYDVRADGEAFALPGGMARTAFGMQYLTQEYFGSTDDFVSIDNDRETPALYGEFFAPLVGAGNRRRGMERLEFTASARYERYEDFSNAFKPRFSLLWEAVEGVRLRGTWGQSFKAPTLFNISASFENPQRTVRFVNTPDTPENGGTSLAVIRSLYGAELEPEESTSWTLGLDLQPARLPGLRLSLTYNDIDFTDKIDIPRVSLLQEAAYANLITRRPPAGDVAGNAAFDQLIADIVSGATTLLYQGGIPPTTPFSAVEVIMDDRYQNLSAVRSRLLDVGLSYGWVSRVGEFRADLNVAYILDQSLRVTPTSPEAVTLNIRGRPVDLRARGRLGWSHDQWSVNGFVNYTDSYRENIGGPPISSWTTVDMNVRYDFGRSAAGWLNGLSGSIAASNLFNRRPPVTIADSAGIYDRFNADAIGRMVTLGLTKAW